MMLIKPSATLEAFTPNPQHLIERAGRTCYRSEGRAFFACDGHSWLTEVDKPTEARPDGPWTCKACGLVSPTHVSGACPGSAPRFIRMLIARGHESVLEHASATVRFVCDRGVSHELVRHRLCSFSQESTRYCDYAKDSGLEFIEPPGLSGGTRDVWLTGVMACEGRYLELRSMGVPPEIARSVLPNALRTEIVVTANLREWRTILRQRCSPKAHPQMREVIEQARAQLAELAPDVFADVGGEESGVVGRVAGAAIGEARCEAAVGKASQEVAHG